MTDYDVIVVGAGSSGEHCAGALGFAPSAGCRKSAALELDAYRFTENAVSDALTVADQTTGMHGEAMLPEERMRDMLERHGPDSANALAHPQREPYLRAAADRVARASTASAYTTRSAPSLPRAGR